MCIRPWPRETGSNALTSRKSRVPCHSEPKFCSIVLLLQDIKAVNGRHPEVLTPESAAVDREFYDFYGTARGWCPNTTTHRALATNAKFMTFYPFNDMPSLSPRPLLLITGDPGAFPRVQRGSLPACHRWSSQYWSGVFKGYSSRPCRKGGCSHCMYENSVPRLLRAAEGTRHPIRVNTIHP
jgi:hypothetical protein